jgi:hypothetical protein
MQKKFTCSIARESVVYLNICPSIFQQKCVLAVSSKAIICYFNTLERYLNDEIYFEV